MLLHVSYFKIYAVVSSLNWQCRRVMIKKEKKTKNHNPIKHTDIQQALPYFIVILSFSFIFSFLWENQVILVMVLLK